MENEVPRKNDTEEREKGENSINIGVKCLNIASFWDCKWMSEVMGGGGGSKCTICISLF